jgi:hypothetical protein
MAEHPPFTCLICGHQYGTLHPTPTDTEPAICGPCYNRFLATLASIIRHAEHITDDAQALLGA